MKNKKLKISLLSLLLMNTVLFGQGLMQITSQPVTARGVGIQAVSTVSLDGAGLAYNPSILSDLERNFQLNYTSYIDDISNISGLVVLPVTKRSKTALLVRHLNYGTFTERNNLGGNTGEFSVNETQIGAAYSRAILNRLRIGILGSWIISNLQDYSAGALAGSVGLRYYDPVSTLSIGLALSNFNYLYDNYTDTEETIGFCWILGISKDLAHLPLVISVDLTDQGNRDINFRLGGEFHLIDNHFFLRFGTSSNMIDLKTQEDIVSFFAGYSAGFGIRISKYQLDMSYLNITDIYGISSINVSTVF